MTSLDGFRGFVRQHEKARIRVRSAAPATGCEIGKSAFPEWRAKRETVQRDETKRERQFGGNTDEFFDRNTDSKGSRNNRRATTRVGKRKSLGRTGIVVRTEQGGSRERPQRRRDGFGNVVRSTKKGRTEAAFGKIVLMRGGARDPGSDFDVVLLRRRGRGNDVRAPACGFGDAPELGRLAAMAGLSEHVADAGSGEQDGQQGGIFGHVFIP